IPQTPVEEIGTSEKSGTQVTFWPDPTIFQSVVYKFSILESRMRELGYLNKGVRLRITDKREKTENGEFVSSEFYSEEGLKEFAMFMDNSREALIEDVIYIDTEKNDIPVEIALKYNTSYAENVHSYVNNINTIEGGTHLLGFRRGLTRTLKKYAEDSGALAKQKIEINGDDFREGLTAIISVKVQEPLFEGQTKTKLGNSEVSLAVDQAVSEMLKIYLEEHPKEAKTIVQKVILAASARIAARNARERVQRK